VRREPPVTAARQIAEPHGPERHAAQPPHAVAQRRAVALDLVLSAARGPSAAERKAETSRGVSRR